MKNRNFFLLSQGLAVSSLGISLYHIMAILWLVEVADSASLVGLLLVAGGLFHTVCTPLGGILADRYCHRKIIVWVDCCNGLLLLGLAGVFYLSMPLPVLIICLLVTQALLGVGVGLFIPTVYTMLPEVLTKDQLAMGNAIIVTVINGTRTLGRAFGGILFILLGTPLIIMLTGMSFLVSAFSESLIRPPRANKDKPKTGSDVTLRKSFNKVVPDLKESGRYILNHHGITNVCLLTVGLSWCLGTLLVIGPFLTQYHLNQDPDWYGYMLAGLSVGLVLGSLYAGRCFNRLLGYNSRSHMLRLSLVIIPVICAGFAVIERATTALLLFILLGIFLGIANTILMTQVQLRASDHLRGRVMSTFSMTEAAMVPLSGLLVGLLIDLSDKEIIHVLYLSSIFGGLMIYPLLINQTLWKFISETS